MDVSTYSASNAALVVEVSNHPRRALFGEGWFRTLRESSHGSLSLARAAAIASRTTGIIKWVPFWQPCFPPFLSYRRNLATVKRIRAQLTGLGNRSAAIDSCCWASPGAWMASITATFLSCSTPGEAQTSARLQHSFTIRARNRSCGISLAPMRNEVIRQALKWCETNSWTSTGNSERQPPATRENHQEAQGVECERISRWPPLAV